LNARGSQVNVPASRWLFDHHRRPTRTNLIALGDSHALVVKDAGRILGWPVSLCAVRGATAQGLHNPHGQTDALAQFQARCDEAKPWQRLVFLLGEVDCGFVIWYRAEKHGVSIDSQVEHSLSAYIGLLERQIARGYEPTVLSVPLPTIQDGRVWGEVANARSKVKASLADRTGLTLEYNARLYEACSRIGAVWVDVTTPTLDPDTGVVNTSYLHPDPANHHLNPDAYARLVADGLSRAMASLPRRDNEPSQSGGLDSARERS
jgi:hypothetical protein